MISVIYEPEDILPGHNDAFVVLDGTLTAQDNFKYTCAIEINGDTVGTLKNRPDPVNGYGRFNIKPILQNYLDSSYFQKLATSVPVELQPYVEFTIIGGESYSVSGVVTSITSYTASGKTAYNTALKYQELAKYRDTFKSTYFNKWLTDRSRTEYIEIDDSENFYMMFFVNPDDPIVEYVITYYDQIDCTGSSLGTQTITALGTDPHLCNIGTQVLAYPGGTLSYKVELKTATVVDTLKFNITACTMFTTVPIVFLNRYGGFETVYFRLISKNKVEVERKSMQKYPVELQGGIPGYITDSVYNTNITDYINGSKEKKTITSETLTDAQYLWLTDLLTSVVVYEEDDGYYIPVKLTDMSYEKKKRINDKLSQLVVDLDYGYLNNSQLR